MKQVQSNTKIAGVDVGKARLDVAIYGGKEAAVFGNTAAGVRELIAWMQERQVGRVGMEASGGYERKVREASSAAGLEVVVHQPVEVRLYARLKRIKAKTDQLDAVLIAAATAHVDAVKAANDPRLIALAEWMTAYEQVTDELARSKTQKEHVTLKDLAEELEIHRLHLAKLKAKLLSKILAMIKLHADLDARFKLLLSLPGVGPVVAASAVVRMPELGSMKHGQAASLLGVAPFARDSGQFKGQRFIFGGRDRPRRMFYLAALTARHRNPVLKAFGDNLKARGKPPKLVLTAVMRKLVEAANLVLARMAPWTADAADKPVIAAQAA
jgi:transposase